jgi:hypothetical protein
MIARPIPPAKSRNSVAIIGELEQEIQEIYDQLDRKSPRGFLNIEIFPASTPKESLPLTNNLAIVLTHSGVNALPKKYATTLKSIIDSAQCRVYIVESSITPLREGESQKAIHSLIQDTPSKSPADIADKVIAFLQDAEKTADLENLKGIRDNFYIEYYERSKVLWPISYSSILLIFAISLLPDLFAPINGIINSIPFVMFLTFFSVFFLVHSVYMSTKNFLYSTVVLRSLSLSVILIGLFLISLAVYAVRFIFLSTQSWVAFGISSSAALLTYLYYLYALRIRAECTSLHEFLEDADDKVKKIETASRIGQIPLGPIAFPLVNITSKNIFISFTRRSAWSCENAFKLYKEFRELGWQVFLDESSIPFGAAWKQRLQRGVSECSYFLALLDIDKSDEGWVLAESMYAALLRKRIGKPIILLALKNDRQRHQLVNTTLFDIYQDILSPSSRKLGGAFFVANGMPLSAELIQRELDAIKPMQLLPGRYSIVWATSGSLLFGGLLTVAMMLSFSESLSELITDNPNFPIWSHLRISVIGINALVGVIFGLYSASHQSLLRDRNSTILASYTAGIFLAVCVLIFLTPQLFQNLEESSTISTAPLLVRVALGFWVGMVGTWAMTLTSLKSHK